jgi:NADH-quinone oxidoreductase subunit L
MGISAAISIIGILIAYYIYILKPATAESIASAAGPLYTLIDHKYYVDEIYGALIVRPIEAFSRTVLWKGVDVAAVDGAVDLLGHRFRGIGAIFRQMQSGSIRNYATWVMLGSLLVLIVLGLAGGAR